MVDNIKYDETVSKINRSNIYGTFVEREVTCAGYAKAFKYVMDKLNFECIIVQGTATSESIPKSFLTFFAIESPIVPVPQ